MVVPPILPPMGIDLSVIPIIAPIIKIVKDGVGKFFKVKDKNVSEAMKGIVNKGYIENVFVIGRIDGDSNVSTFSENKEWIKERLSKGSNAEVIVTDFNDEYIDYAKFKKNQPATDKQELKFSPKYKALITASEYIENMYVTGDHDLASKRKEELSEIKNPDGRKFCNLYTAGYMPDLLKTITESTTSPELAEKLIDATVNYEGILFIHQNSELEEICGNITFLTSQKKPYIALHAMGLNIPKLKKIENTLPKEINGYTIQTGKYTRANEKKSRAQYGVFIFTPEGKAIYDKFINCSFCGF